MKADKWIAVVNEKPPIDVEVETKIANPDRNMQNLVFKGILWYTPSRDMYVYYTPTHWRLKQ